jgi:hypothetical protein
MTHLDEAVARYDKLIHSPAYQDNAWAQEILNGFAARRLAPNGRQLCPVLRPHILSRRQLDAAAKASAVVYAALQRIQQLAMERPALLARFESIPAEKMLAQVEPGYPGLAAVSYAHAQIHNSTLAITGHTGQGPTSVLLTDLMSDVLFDSRPMKELRKKFKLTKLNKGTRSLVHSIFAAYKAGSKSGTQKKFPRIAIVEVSQSVRSAAGADSQLLAEHLRQMGCPAEVVAPEQLEYRNGVLCRGDFGIEIVYRRISAQDLLVRFDLNHPLLRAYRDGAVRMVNSFRAELASKPAILSLLGDEAILSEFPAAERKLLLAHIPWTRVVVPAKTNVGGKSVDLIEYILQNREKLILRPNEASAETQTYLGWETEQPMWEQALRQALRTPHVVQERPAESRAVFPVMHLGRVESREMRVDSHINLFGGKPDGATAHLTDATSAFSLLTGPAPAVVLES